MIDSLALRYAQKLISCQSITPATGAVFDALEAMLQPLGFSVERFIAGQDDADPAHGAPVENLFAIREASGRHFAFAGHLDVVPPGDGWDSDPFTPEIRGDLLHGRGAVDMKGSIAAFVAALHDIPADAGTISLIITGDEEGPAIYGTRALIEHMQARGSIPDACLVGEPTSVNRLGDMMKIGRRGSVNMWISVAGMQGHVAYPHMADNPVPKLIAILSQIDAIRLDDGTDWFQPSNIEITDLNVGNKATNVIPAKAEARLSIRFNDLHSGEALVSRIRELVERGGGTLTEMISGEAFLTPPGELSAAISEAVQSVTGVVPEPSTTGGTSDARFLTKICPVVEFGLRNATMHKLDEAVAIADLDALAEIYRRIAVTVLAA
jgi:succinyl-diaminopimelate desuccinylase